jgi:hypothetical protein
VDWKVQHDRRVAERRERTEHEIIEAEKLQQVRQDVTIETNVKSRVAAWERGLDLQSRLTHRLHERSGVR